MGRLLGKRSDVMGAAMKLMYRVALMRKPSGGDFFLGFARSLEDAAKVYADDNFVDWASEWEMVEA